MKLVRVACVAWLALAIPVMAQETFPSRPVKLVVPFTPGTGIDILARTLGQKLGDEWKVGVVVENRAGASGNIGTEAVAKAPPDGYTLLTTAQTMVVNRALFASLPYDPVKDFAPIAPLAIGSLALVVHPSLNIRTVSELVTYAKANPGKLNYASPGNGTPHHLAMELFKTKAAIDVVHVPYKGTAQAVQDLLGGQVGVMFLPVHVALPQTDAGKLVMLAAGGPTRAGATPSVPSLAEAAGIRDIDTDIWYGLYAPARTPQTVIDRVNADVNRVLKMPDIADTLAKQGLQPTGGTPAALADLTRTDLERWTAVVRAAKIQPD
jgi:tripartite-type tricarboxylate transporter receptor subunit TctC